MTMQLDFSEILSMAAIAISLSVFVFTVIKAKNDRKERIASKRTVVLTQLSSTMLLLENIKIEYRKWLEVEIRLWPDKENELKKRSAEEVALVESQLSEFQKFYDEISDFSKATNATSLEEVLAHINNFYLSMEAIRNRISHAKEKLMTND